MTREEAIGTLEILKIFDAPDLSKAVKMAIAALRAQQESAKLDRSRWEGCEACGDKFFVARRQYMRPIIAPLTPEQALMDKLTDLTGIAYVRFSCKFCPACGRPLTEEAWAELERRIGGNDGKDDV